jgi:hypothetical protein
MAHAKNVGILTILQKASLVWGFLSDNWNAPRPSFLRFDFFSSEFLTILQKASPATDGLEK